MLKGRLIYVELKTGYGDSGPAWIGIAGASKSGATIYFNGEAFKSLKGSGIGGNFYNIENGDQYWISGIKKNNQDRHWAGGGKIIIDETAVPRYLKAMNYAQLPKNLIVETLLPSKQAEEHAELEHQDMTDIDQIPGRRPIKKTINGFKRTF